TGVGSPIEQGLMPALQLAMHCHEAFVAGVEQGAGAVTVHQRRKARQVFNRFGDVVGRHAVGLSEAPPVVLDALPELKELRGAVDDVGVPQRWRRSAAKRVEMELESKGWNCSVRRWSGQRC